MSEDFPQLFGPTITFIEGFGKPHRLVNERKFFILNANIYISVLSQDITHYIEYESLTALSRWEIDFFSRSPGGSHQYPQLSLQIS